jgi:hypothetical protein
VEASVWSELAEALSDSDRLMALADDALGHSLAVVNVSRDDLGALDRKIDSLERKIGTRIAELIGDDFDATTIKHATAKLNAELDDLRARRSKAAAWAATNARTATKKRRLWEMASDIRRWMDTPDDTRRRQVIDILELRIEITGWTTCASCSGKGVVSIPPEERIPGGKKIDGCTTCRRLCCLPSFVMTGSIPAEPVADEESAPVPFRREVAAAS